MDTRDTSGQRARRIPFGRLADKLNRRRLVILGSLLYFSLVPFIPHTPGFVPILLLNITLGVCGAVSLPAASALVVEEGRNFGMGSTMAIFNVSMSVGLAVGPITSGLVLDLLGISGVFYFCTALGIFGTFIVSRLFSNTSGITQSIP